MQLEADSIGEGSPNQFPCPALTMAHIDDPAEQIKKSCIWIDDAIEKGMSATKIISHHYLNGSWSSNALMSAQPRKKAKTISTLSAYEHRAHSLHYSVSRRTHASTHVTDSSNLSKLLYHVVPGLASRWSAPMRKGAHLMATMAQLEIYSEPEITPGNGAEQIQSRVGSTTAPINMAKEIK